MHGRMHSSPLPPHAAIPMKLPSHSIRKLAAAVGLVLVANAPNGCICSYLGPKGEPPELPSDPHPLSDLNTEFDDFNAAARYRTVDVELVFSSNRASPDRTFDLFTSQLRFTERDVSASPAVPFLSDAMSPANEYGPLFLGDTMLAFASDRPGGAGKLDLYRTHLARDASSAPPEAFTGLNSPANDAYLATYAGAALALFASDRNGSYDIFEVLPHEKIFAPDARPQLVSALSSSAHDTAPFLFEHTPSPEAERVSLNPRRGKPREHYEAQRHAYVVFASGRAGGRGGFDLYCSRLDEGRWQEPRPLTELNSPSDEFRPIIADMSFGGGEVIIFSSNRPGGKGGFDLYYAKFEDPFGS
mgnify:FL=1